MRARRRRSGGPGPRGYRALVADPPSDPGPAPASVPDLATPSGPVVHDDHPRSPRAQALRRAYALHLAEAFGGTTAPDGLPPAAAFDAAADDDLAAPGGAFWVATLHGEPVGCAGARTLIGDLVLPGSALAGAVELKRFFALPAARGHGVGRALLARAEAWATARGAGAVALDTSSTLVAAGRLYRSSGYAEVVAYNANPHADVWLAKHLAR